MKRLESILTGKCEKNASKIKMEFIENALQRAELNAKAKISKAELKMKSELEKLANDNECVDNIIRNVNSALNDKQDGEAELQQANLIRDYLNEEVEVEEPACPMTKKAKG